VILVVVLGRDVGFVVIYHAGSRAVGTDRGPADPPRGTAMLVVMVVVVLVVGIGPRVGEIGHGVVLGDELEICQLVGALHVCAPRVGNEAEMR